jgi:hypothetical protein
MLPTVFIVVLILLLVGAIPGAWPHSKDWSRGPASAILVILVLVIILALTGHL